VNISLGACTPVPTVVDDGQGGQKVILGGCPSTTVEVTPSGGVFTDTATGVQTWVPNDSGTPITGGSNISTGALAMILGGIALVMFLAKR
jgi:hypothetical protein